MNPALKSYRNINPTDVTCSVCGQPVYRGAGKSDPTAATLPTSMYGCECAYFSSTQLVLPLKQSEWERNVKRSGTDGPSIATAEPPQSNRPAFIASFTIHPLAEKFPPIPPEDFEELKESIRKYGLFEPIIINDQGQILDGRHRYRALIELGMELKAYQSTISFEEVRTKDKPLTEEQFIYDSNIHRRHLTKTQIAAILLSFTNLATVAKPTQKSKSTEVLGKQSGVSGRLIRRVKAIKERDPERFEEVRTGKLEVRDAERAFAREDHAASVKKCKEERGQETAADEINRLHKELTESGFDINKLEVPAGHTDYQGWLVIAQQKLELAIRQCKEKLASEFHQAVNARVEEFLEQTIMPKLQEEQNEARRIINSRKGIIDRKTYKKILSCLHPDRVTDSQLKQLYEEAFRLFSVLEKRLLDEKNSPTQFVNIPKTKADWDELKRQAATARKTKLKSHKALAKEMAE